MEMLCSPVLHVSNWCRLFDFVFNARTSSPDTTVICLPFLSFCKVGGIPSDTQSHSCFLNLSHIGCNVGPFQNIRISGLNTQDQVNIIHIQVIFWASVNMPSQLSIPCLLQACAFCVSHFEYNTENGNSAKICRFHHQILMLFIVVGIWYTYPTGFTLVCSMI